ncbi:hypothetical protein SB781_08505 [Paraburkholderia sp. SIMBA_061]|jgi:hypothetical protein
MLWTGPPIDVCGAAPTKGACQLIASMSTQRVAGRRLFDTLPGEMQN